MKHTSRRGLGVIAAGAVIALSTGAVRFASAGALDAPTLGTASSFVPILPCRVLDTRTASLIGPHAGPLGPDETMTLPVLPQSLLNACGAPDGATAITANVTIDNPTRSSYLTVYPANLVRPGSSNLNWTASSSPTPN